MPIGEERHMPNTATVRERRIRQTKAQLIDEIDTLEHRAGRIRVRESPSPDCCETAAAKHA